MKHAAVTFCWVCVIVSGVFLRFDHPAKRPFHADEATGARIAAKRMESNGGNFDPTHYHGPLLADLAIPLCHARGQSGWATMDKATLRFIPAIAGSLLLLVPLLWRRRFGDGPMLLAAACLATSPLLVYYSRTFIHESLLVLFGMLALVALTCFPRTGRTAIPGVLMGLMFAAKESFAISILAWAGAAVILLLEHRKSINRSACLTAWHRFRMPVALTLLAAGLTAIAFYTHGFRHPQGAIDAIRTFFVYETVEGHDKPFSYYFTLLTLPEKSGGRWWFETPILILALIAYAGSFRRSPEASGTRNVIRFLSYSALGHFLIYGLFSYKTPWLACLPWAHVCLLAGFSVLGFRRFSMPVKAALVLFASGTLFSQFTKARLATGRFASDERNPYAYVPTRNDIERLETWLGQLRESSDAPLEPIAVIGDDYWPLPWYLRSFGQIGYWPEAPENLQTFPLVFAMPETTDAVFAQLENTHVVLPRGLRPGVAVDLYLRNDIWNQWMESDR